MRRLGAGGMGEVWLAEHAMLGRRAAIKVLHPAFSANTEIVTRFFNEARAATAIADPGIVQIFDFGRDTDGMAFIVMELLDGESLEARLRRCGRLPLAEAVRLLRQVAGSLAAAHARSVVHRDLKPDNIFIVPDPEAVGGERTKLLDFGIAKLAAEGGAGGVKTQTSAVMGTPIYMSPEQCRGAGQVDHRSDLYALGCILFQLVAGRPPFDAEGMGEILAMHLREAPPRLAAVVPGIPPALDELVARCLAKDPAQRPGSAMALGAELGALLAILPVSSAVLPTVAGPALSSPSHPAFAGAPIAVTTLSSAAAGRTAPPAPPRRHRGVIAGVAGGLVASGLVVFALARGGSSGAPAGDAPPAPSPAPTVTPAAKPAPPPPAPAPAPPPPKPTPPVEVKAEPAPPPVAKPAPRPAVVAKPAPRITPPPPVVVAKPPEPVPAAGSGAKPDEPKRPKPIGDGTANPFERKR